MWIYTKKVDKNDIIKIQKTLFNMMALSIMKHSLKTKKEKGFFLLLKRQM